MKGQITPDVLQPQIRPLLVQYLHRLQLALGGAAVRRRPALVVLMVHIRPRFEQQPDAVRVAEGGGVEEGRTAAGINLVDVGAANHDQYLGELVVAATGGAVQSCVW